MRTAAQLPARAPATTPVVVATGIGVDYGSLCVLDETNIVIESGTELAVTGRSGSGKTTLLLVLAGLVRPDRGTVRWPGLDGNSARRRHQIGLVFQAPSLLPELTATENVALPLRLSGYSQRQAADAAAAALAIVDLLDAGPALPAQLSGGMQQRVAVARVLAGAPRVVFADEPTGALDRANAITVLTALRDHVQARAGSLIVATHDDELAALLADRAVLVDGRLRMRDAS